MFGMYPIQYDLPQSRIPQAWYNILPDLPKPLAPVLHPGTLKPIGPDDLAPLFPVSLILQEVSADREIEIPAEVREVYRQWRPSPLYRARRLERSLDTPAKIYYKYEGVSPAGSHKPNTAVAQAYYNKKEGTKRLSTETGAGQWGSSLAMACAFFGLECEVYMVRVSYNQKPYRRALMEAFGASVAPSPSDKTESGRPFWRKTRNPTARWVSLFPRPSRLLPRTHTPNTRWAATSTASEIAIPSEPLDCGSCAR